MQNPFGNNNQTNQDFFNNLPIPPNYAKIKNDEGEMRIAKVGFSWTVFLFGPFPALFRNDWYNFFLMIVLDLDYVLVGLFFKWNWMLDFPWPTLFFCFFYNMMYFRHLFTKGFYPADERSKELLTQSGYWKEKYRQK